jgi:hypothetical protein
MSDHAAIRRVALADLGKRRSESLRSRETLDVEIAREVDRATRCGVSFSACAELVGLSRQGLYNLLDRYAVGLDQEGNRNG